MAPDGLDGYSSYRGQTPNKLNERMLDLRAERLRTAKEPVCDLVFVYDYDALNQTVDVVLMNDKRSQPIRGIPIAGTGGHGVRIIRAWKGILDTDKPDIGVLVYPRLGGGRRLLDFIRRDTNAIYASIERTAIFLGGIPAALSAGETPVANVVDGISLLHQIGKDDNGILKPSGAGFMVKGTDDVVIRGRNIYFLGLNQTIANAQAVARQGDAGDGLGGSIAGGSAVVYSG